MVDDVAVSIVQDIIRFPVVYTIDVEIMPQKIVMELLGGAKLANGKDIRLHEIQNGSDALILTLGVVGGLLTTAIALVIAILQQIVLHHGNDGLLSHRSDRTKRQGKKNKKTSHF